MATNYLSLRSTVTYNSDRSVVPQGSLYGASTNNTTAWLNTLSLPGFSTLTGSTIVGGTLVTQGTTYMAGNVGIGTNIPTTILHVNTSQTSTSTGVLSTRYYLKDPGDNQDGSGTNYDGPWYGLGWSGISTISGDPYVCLSGYAGVALRSGNGYTFLSNNGNFGIGTTNPTSNLHLSTSMTADLGGALKTQYTDIGITAASLVVNSGGTLTGSGPYTFTTNAINGSLRVATTLPLGAVYRLQITCNITAGSGYLLLTDGVGAVYTSPTLTSSYQVLTITGTAVSTNQILYFQVISASGTVFNYSAVSIQRLDTVATGNVGIGVTNPYGKLTVYGGTSKSHLRIMDENNDGSGSTFFYPVASYYARQDAIIRTTDPLTATNGASASIVFTDRPGTASWSANTRNSDILFYTADNVSNDVLGIYPKERMRITAGGNVGIGTNSANTTLQVNGPVTTRYFTVTVSSGTTNVLQNVAGPANPFFAVNCVLLMTATATTGYTPIGGATFTTTAYVAYGASAPSYANVFGSAGIYPSNLYFQANGYGVDLITSSITYYGTYQISILRLS